MKTETIIQKLVRSAESFGVVHPEIISEKFHAWNESPRCRICGYPLTIVDMDTTTGVYVGCPKQNKKGTHTEFHISTV